MNVTLMPIQEENVTLFQQHAYFISLHSLESISFLSEDEEHKRHIALSDIYASFPKVKDSRAIELLLSFVLDAIREGQEHFVFVYNDDNYEEAYDLFSGLSNVFGHEVEKGPLHKWSHIVPTVAAKMESFQDTMRR